MVTENSELLRDLLYVHLAPPTKQSITRARKQFKDLRGTTYPITEETLLKQLTPHTEGKIQVPDLVPGAEVDPASTDDDGPAAD